MDSNYGDNIFAILVHRSQIDRAPEESTNTIDSRRPPLILVYDELMRGLIQARKLGCTHAVVFDHQADDLPLLLQASSEHPAGLVVGYRTESLTPDRFRHLLLRLETGLRLKDLHGPRVYPLKLIEVIDPQGNRQFGEAEILVRAAWAGCPIIQTPLAAHLPTEHLHSPSMRQILRELATHIRLIARALSAWPHAKYGEGIVPTARRPFWPRVWRWLNPFAAWRELRQGGISRNEMAVGLAAGAFIGNMPVWGFHTAISLYVAKRLHLNPLAVMTGSHVSAPPMGPALIASAMWIGHVILHGSRPRWDSITLFHGHFMANAVPLLLDWTLGGVLIGTALAIVVYIVANFLFQFIERPEVDVRADVDTLPVAPSAGNSPLSLPRA